MEIKSIVRSAFIACRQRFSADRVVADPALNAAFQANCAENSSRNSELEFNLCLLNLRKAGYLTGLPRSRRTSFANEGDYRHASEVAARFLETREGVSLDRIICDPLHVADFDEIASEVCPGFSSLQYRWAALNLRKQRQLRPELLSRVIVSEAVSLGAIRSIPSKALPAGQGIYVFYSADETLYIGEAQNLKKRVSKHVDHSDNKELARWFWKHGFKDVFLELQVFPADTSTRARKAMEAELISSRKPLFNIQGANR